MSKFFSLALIALALLSCRGHHPVVQQNVDGLTEASLDTLDIHVLKPDTSVLNYVFPYAAKYEDLSKAELLVCERLVKKYVEGYNILALERYEEMKKENPGMNFIKESFTIELHEYGRQYIAAIENGQKVVYGNFFCEPTWYKRRKKQLVIANDGGNCYFSMKINLATGELYDFMENGKG
ncbi:MAG: hypothetical protein JSS79_15085 [Bacteroidetes bacterium]|nr:hypothetical protein [Bacteroidota bacterium]